MELGRNLFLVCPLHISEMSVIEFGNFYVNNKILATNTSEAGQQKFDFAITVNFDLTVAEC